MKKHGANTENILFASPITFQTTNNIFDKTLYAKVKPQSLLAWQRVRLSNHMAANGSHWFDLVKRYNSGTYNNQYMVLDLTKIKVGEYVEDDALWVVEQIPGLVLGKGMMNSGQHYSISALLDL